MAQLLLFTPLMRRSVILAILLLLYDDTSSAYARPSGQTKTVGTATVGRVRKGFRVIGENKKPVGPRYRWIGALGDRPVAQSRGETEMRFIDPKTGQTLPTKDVPIETAWNSTRSYQAIHRLSDGTLVGVPSYATPLDGAPKIAGVGEPKTWVDRIDPVTGVVVESSAFALRSATSSWQNSLPKVAATAPYKSLTPAKRRPIDALFSRTEPSLRPSMEEVEGALRQAYGEIPNTNPFGSGLKPEAAVVADIVAQLEHAYPGGTYLPLGRDAVLIADLLDGFYRSIGQPDRVRRLNASGTSFPHYRSATPETYEQDRPITYGFLESNGLDLDQISTAPPYVMIDVTSYMSTSQSRQLMRAVYRTWSEKGRDPKALADKVAFVGIGSSGRTISEISDIEDAKAELRAHTTKDGPERILYLGGSVSRLTYTDAWHEMFLSFTSNGQGKVTTAPGNPRSERDRLRVLADQYEALKLVSDPAFLARVRTRASQKYGYDFPLTRTQKLQRTVRAASVGSPLVETTATPPPRQDASVLLAMQYSLSREPRDTRATKALEFLEDVAGMWGRGTISRREVCRVGDILAEYVPAGEPLSTVIRSSWELNRKYPGFFEALTVPEAVR